MLRHFIVEEHGVLQPHVEVPEDFLFDLSNVCRAQDELGCQSRLRVKLLVLPRLEQVWVVLIVEELLEAQQQRGELQLSLVAEILVPPLRVCHLLRVLRKLLQL